MKALRQVERVLGHLSHPTMLLGQGNLKFVMTRRKNQSKLLIYSSLLSIQVFQHRTKTWGKTRSSRLHSPHDGGSSQKLSGKERKEAREDCVLSVSDHSRWKVILFPNFSCAIFTWLSLIIFTFSSFQRWRWRRPTSVGVRKRSQGHHKSLQWRVWIWSQVLLHCGFKTDQHKVRETI